MRVRVPGSIANIGPGFDCMAMAIDLWLEVEAELAETPAWDFEGEGAEYLAAHDNPFTRLNMRGRVPRPTPSGISLRTRPFMLIRLNGLSCAARYSAPSPS